MRERNKYSPEKIAKILDLANNFYVFCSHAVVAGGLGQTQNSPEKNKLLAKDYVRAYRDFKEKVPKNIRDSLVRKSKTLREYITLGSVLEKSLDEKID